MLKCLDFSSLNLLTPLIGVLITQQTDTLVTFPWDALLPTAVNPGEALVIFIELRFWFNIKQVHILNCLKGCRASFTASV